MLVVAAAVCFSSAPGRAVNDEVPALKREFSHADGWVARQQVTNQLLIAMYWAPVGQAAVRKGLRQDEEQTEVHQARIQFGCNSNAMPSCEWGSIRPGAPLAWQASQATEEAWLLPGTQP